MFGGRGVKRLAWAGATTVLALAAAAPFCGRAVAADLPPEVTWDDAYWQISGADEAAAIVANTRAVAFAHVVASQTLANNVLNLQDMSSSALIQDSFNGDAGIIDVNQQAGDLNNQANVRAFAYTPGLGTLQAAQADVTMAMYGNSITTSGGALSAGIDGSFNNTVGIVGVNQAAGSLNEEVNVLALSLGASPGADSIILDDATLALIGTPDQNTENKDPNKPRQQTTSMTNSFNNFTGIAQVNQVAGDLNRVDNVMAVSVMTMR